MYHRPKLEKYMRSLLKHLEGGLLKALLTPELSLILADVKRGCMILNQSVIVWNQKWISLHRLEAKMNKNLRSFIVEFHQKNRYQILNDSKLSWKLLSLIVKQLPMLVPVSTLTNQDYPDWWKWYVDNRSQELWLPSKIDYLDLDMNSSKKCVKNIAYKSWFTLTNNHQSIPMKTWKQQSYKRISYPSSMSSLPEEMEKKQESSEDLEKTKVKPNSVLKIKLYPTNTQKVLLNNMFGTHRAIYNKLVEKSAEDCYKLSLSELNKKYRPISQKHSLVNYLPEYHLNVPEDVMNSTYRDFYKAIVSSKALYHSLKDKGDKTSFPMLGFKSKKDNTTSIEIQPRSFKSIENVLNFYPRYFGFKTNKDGIQINENIDTLICSVRLQRTRAGQFYLCIPRNTVFDQTNSKRTCAIDPGVRGFITIYDPHGLTLSVEDCNNKIFNRCLTIDKLQSKLTKCTSKRTRFRIKRTIYNSFQRIKRMIDDMHQKVSRWLSDNYAEVLLPKFATSDLTSKQKRISSKVSRAMLTWSHYKFKKMLEYKMQRSGGRAIECTEYYTTKTCSCCGRINHNIIKQKVFTCPQCNLLMDRDVNAARNIYLKNEYLLSWDLRSQVSEKPTPRLSQLQKKF